MASAKQLAARRKFAKIMKSGGFKKRKSKTKKRIKSTIKVGGINYKATRTTTTLTKKQLLALKRRRKINKGVNKRSSVKRSLGLKSITGSSTIKKVALGIGGGVMATAILSAVMPNSSVAKFAAPAGAFALGGIEGVIGNFALSMLGSRTGSNTNVAPQMEAL
jgi:hypothetical protein